MNEQQNQQPQGGGATVAAPPAPVQAQPPVQERVVTERVETARPQRPPVNPRRIFLLNGLGLLVLLLIALGAYYLWRQGYYFYGTDDAKVDGPIAAVAPPAPGTLTKVNYALGDTVNRNATIAMLRSASGGTINAVSPIAGTIIQEGATPGEVLPAGQPLAQVVNLNALYITAYVEENHINDVHTGQGVDVKVDAIGGTTFHGTVTRILPTSAAALSPIPSTDYASGNFTKTTQRVPVQITLDGYQGHTLFPGESATVTIHIHE